MLDSLSRRALIAGATALCAAPFARATWRPERPVEMLVSYAPGGTADGIARLLAQKLQEKRRWILIVINRPGGGGVVMQRALKSAKPDGYTVGLCASHELTYPPADLSDAPFLMKDFRFLASVAEVPHCLVGRPRDRLETLEAWRSYAKGKGSLSIGFSQPYERVVERIGTEFGIKVVPVPFKGGAEMMQQIVAGNLDLGWSAGSHLSLEQAGLLKPYLALTPTRLADYPQVLTAREFGGSIAVESRFVVLGSSTLPPGIAVDFENALQEAMADPATRSAISARGLMPDSKIGTPLAEALKAEADNARVLIR